MHVINRILDISNYGVLEALSRFGMKSPLELKSSIQVLEFKAYS